MEEATASQTLGIFPFKHSPFTILEKIFDDADHLTGGKFLLKHLLNSLTSDYRRQSNLVVDRILFIKAGERLNISSIKGVHPEFHEFFWFHAIEGYGNNSHPVEAFETENRKRMNLSAIG